MTATLTTPEEPAMRSDFEPESESTMCLLKIFYLYLLYLFIYLFCTGLWCSISSVYCAWQDAC